MIKKDNQDMDKDKSTDWLNLYNKELIESSEASLKLEGIDSQEIDMLLEIAKVVAHGTERKNAPLATYLVGRYVASRKILDSSISITTLIDQALAIAESMVNLDE